MKIRIWHKLALVLIATVTAVILLTFFLAQSNFRSNFSDYLKEQEQRRVQLISERLSGAYELTNSWDFIRGKRYVLKNLLPEFSHKRPPRGSDKHRFGEHKPPKQIKRRHIGMLHALLDKDKIKVVGSIQQGPDVYDTPIKLDNEVIGFLRTRSISGFTNRVDKQFVQSQHDSFIDIVIIALLLSLVAAWLFSRYFQRRISQLTGIANDLTAGNFDRRIIVDHQDELAELGNTFNVLAGTLEKNRKSQKQWIADISHELRTPLAILIGELDALQDGIRPINKPAIESLSNEAAHLHRLVNDLYQLSLSDLAKLDYHKSCIQFAPILQRVIDQFRPLISEHSLTLDIAIEERKPSYVLADEQRLVQLFSNLIDNAIKYTDSGGRISICCKLLQNEVFISINDSFPSVPTESLPRIFDRLYRVEASRNRKTGGAGLGLAIAASIVDAHEGSIKVSQSDLGGLQVIIKFPIKEQ